MCRERKRSLSECCRHFPDPSNLRICVLYSQKPVLKWDCLLSLSIKLGSKQILFAHIYSFFSFAVTGLLACLFACIDFSCIWSLCLYSTISLFTTSISNSSFMSTFSGLSNLLQVNHPHSCLTSPAPLYCTHMYDCPCENQVSWSLSRKWGFNLIELSLSLPLCTSFLFLVIIFFTSYSSLPSHILLVLVISKLDLCERGSFSTAIFYSDIQQSFSHFVFNICLSVCHFDLC